MFLISDTHKQKVNIPVVQQRCLMCFLLPSVQLNVLKMISINQNEKYVIIVFLAISPSPNPTYDVSGHQCLGLLDINHTVLSCQHERINI